MYIKGSNNLRSNAFSLRVAEAFKWPQGMLRHCGIGISLESAPIYRV